jgi:hypothetical protein
VLCLCNGLDKVGTLAELPGFLTRARQLVVTGGLLIADSFDLRVGANEARLRALSRKQSAGRYFGELDLQFEYKGQLGSPFSTLQVDLETLTSVAQCAGWRCELIEQRGGHYLVCATAA